MQDHDDKMMYQLRIKRMVDGEHEMYQRTADDQKRLAKWIWSPGNERSPNIEAFIHLIPGYVWGNASSIAYHGTLKDARQRLENLKHYGIHNNADFKKWFLEESDNYEKIRDYVLYVDYLRLMTMEYIRLYLLDDEE